MKIKTFWVVTKPTNLSVLEDICFESNPANFARQVLGGLKPEDVVGFWDNQADAEAVAIKAAKEFQGVH